MSKNQNNVFVFIFLFMGLNYLALNILKDRLDTQTEILSRTIGIIGKLSQQNEKLYQKVLTVKRENDVLLGFINSTNERLYGFEDKLVLFENSIEPDNFRFLMVKKIRDAVKQTVKDFNYSRAMLTREITDYAEAVFKYSAEYDVPITLILAITRQESAFNKYAKSSANARGLMQIIPSTAEEISMELSQKHYNLYNVSDNVKFGTYYLMTLMDRYKGNLETVLQAYNCGPTCVNRVQSGQYEKFPNQTIDYVNRILGECIKQSENEECEILGYRKYYKEMGF